MVRYSVGALLFAGAFGALTGYALSNSTIRDAENSKEEREFVYETCIQHPREIKIYSTLGIAGLAVLLELAREEIGIRKGGR